MLTYEEVSDAKVLLEPFLREYQLIGIERMVILAYLFGIKQGFHEIYGPNATESLTKHLRRVYAMGKTHGFTEASAMSQLSLNTYYKNRKKKEEQHE